VEVKLTATPLPAAAKGVEKFLSFFPETPKGYVACMVKKPVPLSQCCTAIPAWEVSSLLD